MATNARRSRFTLLGLMLFVAISALAMTVVVQSIRLRDAAIRERRLHAELDKHRLSVKVNAKLLRLRTKIPHGPPTTGTGPIETP